MTWQALDEFGFDATLAAAPGVSLVMFGQPHCGACRGWQAQLPQWLADQAVQLWYADVARAQALAHRFELFQLPAFALYRDGRFHAMWQSTFSAQAVGQALAAALAASPQEEP
jgi:thioredoxin-like negative regulator of GroEL